MPIYAKFRYGKEIIVVYVEDLLCPITKILLVDPVIAFDGYTYSSATLLDKIAEAKVHATEFVSPVTGEPIATSVGGVTKVFRLNRAIKDILDTPWQEGQKIPEVSADNFLCPIGLLLLTDPRVANDERTYEFSNLQQATQSSTGPATLPIDRQPRNLSYPNLALKNIIKRFMLSKGLLVDVNDPLHRVAIEYTAVGKVDELARLNESNIKANLLVSPLHPDGFQMAHIAALKGQIEVLKWLVSKNINLNSATPLGNTPLHMAAMSGDVEAITYLQQQKLDVYTFGSNGFLPVHYAAFMGKHEAVMQLLKFAPDTINVPTKNGKTLLLIAAVKNIDIAKWLLEQGADYKITDQSKNNILHLISSNAAQADEGLYKTIIEHCKDIQLERNMQGFEPLHTAVMNKNQFFISCWLKYADAVKCYIDERDFKGSTALVYACVNKLSVVVNMLLQAGANPNIKTIGGTSAIFFAIMQNEFGMVKDLCMHGAELFVSNNNAQTILDIAVEVKTPDQNILNFILDKAILGESRANPLHLIAASKITSDQPDIVIKTIVSKIIKEQFIQYINQADKTGKTPICYAIQNLNLKFTNYLLSQGAVFPSDEQLGFSLLCEVAERGNAGFITLCLINGRNLDQLGKNGKTPRQIIQALNNEALLELLIPIAVPQPMIIPRGGSAIVAVPPSSELEDRTRALSLH